jgi:FlaA1/EpsC-like NDP-sugar epimerase
VSRDRRRAIVEALEAHPVEIRSMPGLADLVSGKAQISDLRRVSPEDLLGRDPVAPRPDLMAKNITGKVVLVTGAGGSIGRELCRQILAQAPARLVLVDHSEYALYAIDEELRAARPRHPDAGPVVPVLGSVQTPGRMRAVLDRFGVQTVYHAAAYKHVPLVERNVVEGLRNNVFGTRVMAEQAVAAGVEAFILVSTDKAVRPTNVMGASKRMAELICQAQAQRPGGPVFSMVRFGNVLGSSGSVIPRFQRQIEAGGPVTVTHPEITRFFMTVPEAAQLVIQAGAMARGGEVFLLDMGEPVRIADLADRMVRLHGLVPFYPGTAGSVEGDVAVVFTGLREGEKLHEELLVGEESEPTAHPRILSAREADLPDRDLAPLLDELLAACKAQDLGAMRRILLSAPSGYRPQHASSDLMQAEPPQDEDARAAERTVA